MAEETDGKAVEETDAEKIARLEADNLRLKNENAGLLMQLDTAVRTVDEMQPDIALLDDLARAEEQVFIHEQDLEVAALDEADARAEGKAGRAHGQLVDEFAARSKSVDDARVQRRAVGKRVRARALERYQARR